MKQKTKTTLLDDYQNTITVGHCIETMCNGKNSTVFKMEANSSLYNSIRSVKLRQQEQLDIIRNAIYSRIINIGRAFINDQYFSLLENSSRQAYELLLTNTHVGSILINH
jgi:hypothetical protein